MKKRILVLAVLLLIAACAVADAPRGSFYVATGTSYQFVPFYGGGTAGDYRPSSIDIINKDGLIGVALWQWNGSDTWTRMRPDIGDSVFWIPAGYGLKMQVSTQYDAMTITRSESTPVVVHWYF